MIEKYSAELNVGRFYHHRHMVHALNDEYGKEVQNSLLFYNALVDKK